MSDSGNHPVTRFAAFESDAPAPIPVTSDTDPLPAPARLPSDMHHDTDMTPPDGPFAIRQVLRKLEAFDSGFAEMREHCRLAADRSLLVLSEVQALTGKVAALEKRVTAIELADRWVPRLAWAVTTAIAIIALLRTFKG